MRIVPLTHVSINKKLKQIRCSWPKVRSGMDVPFKVRSKSGFYVEPPEMSLFNNFDQVVSLGEDRIFDLVRPDFSESSGYMQYLLGDGVFYIYLITLL